jgi:hypothetical protein
LGVFYKKGVVFSVFVEKVAFFRGLGDFMRGFGSLLVFVWDESCFGWPGFAIHDASDGSQNRVMEYAGY